MGISNKFHFSLWDETIEPIREEINKSLPQSPNLLGLGENTPSPFLSRLLKDRRFSYRACDRFPSSPDTNACDINDLAFLFNEPKFDVVCLFRASMFVRDKSKFLEELVRILNPGGFLFIDFLIGSSDLPVLDFRYGNKNAVFYHSEDEQAIFQSSFYDDLLVNKFPLELESFCKHARNWPISTQINYFLHQPRFFFRDFRDLKRLTIKNLGLEMKTRIPEKQLFNLNDFQGAGFKVRGFQAKYFYPMVKKFNLYCCLAAQYKER